MRTAGTDRDQVWQLSLAKHTYYVCLYFSLFLHNNNSYAKLIPTHTKTDSHEHGHAHIQLHWLLRPALIAVKILSSSIFIETAHEKLITEMPHVIILEIWAVSECDGSRDGWYEWHIWRRERERYGVCFFEHEHLPVRWHFVPVELLTVCGCSCSV